MIELNYYIELLLKFVITLVFAAVIGYDRGRKNQAGVRTHILVSIGSLLSILITLRALTVYPEANTDLFRVSAQVVSGIGFLGAGSIIKTGNTVKGLTTAASLWTVALLAITIGCGFYVISIIAFISIIFSLKYLHHINFISTKKYRSVSLTINFDYTMDNQISLTNKLIAIGIKEHDISTIRYEQNNKNPKLTIVALVKTRYTMTPLNMIINDITKIEYVNKILFVEQADILNEE